MTFILLFLSIGILAQTTISYQYDNLQRLTQVVYPTGSYIKYSYDSNGNRNQEVKIQQSLFVEETYYKKGLNVFPNPFYEELNVISKKEDILELALYDVSGKLIRQEQMNRQKKITLKAPNLPSGVYLLIIVTTNGKETIKVIKK